MERLLVIILVSLAISIVGLKIAEVYEYENYKKAWGEQHKKLGGKSSNLRLRRLKLYYLKEDSFTENWGRGLSLYGGDSYKYAPSDLSH